MARWYGDDFLVEETEWMGEIADARFWGLPGRRGRATFSLLHVFEVRDALISREEIWFEVAAIAAQLGAPGPRDAATRAAVGGAG